MKIYNKENYKSTSPVKALPCTYAPIHILSSSFFGVRIAVLMKVFLCRKHSCGEQEAFTLPSPPLHHAGEDSSQVSLCGCGVWRWQASFFHVLCLNQGCPTRFPVICPTVGFCFGPYLALDSTNWHLKKISSWSMRHALFDLK